MNIKTAEEFISEIVRLYSEARDISYKECSGRVERGRSHPVSSKAEDLLALALINNLRKKLIYKVDQPITINNKTIYPDIAIVKNDEIVNFVDLKMDLGWKRNKFTDFCKSIDKRTRKHQGMGAKLKNGRTKGVTFLTVSYKL